MTLRYFLALGCLCLGACDVVTYGSNLPDGGTCPVAPPGSGSGTLSGPLAFGVQAALEKKSQLIPLLPDGGPDTAHAGLPFTSLALYSQPMGCGLGDGGQAAFPIVLAWLYNRPQGVLQPGVVPVLPADETPDGGSFATLLYGNEDAGLLAATAGQIQLSAVQSCALTGSFDVSFVQDGGAADAGPALEGSFSAVYCP